MIDDLDLREMLECAEMQMDYEREDWQAKIDAQAATIEAMRARLAKADELAERAEQGASKIDLQNAAAAYRATPTDTGAA
jgi:nitrate reductase assembly molybdenum cofactor insertion protein NarJ